jgi:hypothetical protein
MFAGLTERLRLDIQTIKDVVDLHDHARALFYPSAISETASTGVDPVDSWARFRGRSPKRAEWQIYDHCAALTRLYAVYSIFIDDAISEFLRVLPQLYDRYDQLPPAVLKQHRVGFGQILLKLGEFGPYRHLREEEIIEQLSHGLAGKQPYVLLADAFFVDRQNYRLEHLARLLGHMGIDNAGARIAAHPAMASYLERELGESASLDGELGRFVQLRNEAAHGQVGEVIGAEDFRLLADFIRTVCEIVGEIILRELLERRLALGQLALLGPVEHVYHEGTIAIVKMKAATVAVGEQVALIRNGRIVHLAVVRSIMEDDVSRDSIAGQDGQELGIGLDSVCKVGMLVAKTATESAIPEPQQPLFAPEDQVGLAEDALPADINEVDSISEVESQPDDLSD